MKTFTIKDIRSWDPCYDPNKYLSEDWEGTVIDILNMDQIPFGDRLWCVLRTNLLSETLMRLFAVWSYRQTLIFIKNTDPRSLKAAEVAEAYALRKATKEELAAAESAAWAAARAAVRAAADFAAESTRCAARAAAWSTADSAAESATWAAGESTRSAADSAAWAAVKALAESAAWAAVRDAADSAAESARAADTFAQKQKLIEMILEEEKTKI